MNYTKLIFPILIMTMTLWSCAKENQSDIAEIQSNSGILDFEKSTNPSLDALLKSVAIIQYVDENPNSDSTSVKVEFLFYGESSFVPNKVILNKHRYSDDGKDNDAVAGDGIYTSVKRVATDIENRSIVYTSSDFEHEDELEDDLYLLGFQVSLTCDVGLSECPETDWWNTCWPLPSPCTCLEWSNCEAEISYGW